MRQINIILSYDVVCISIQSNFKNNKNPPVLCSLAGFNLLCLEIPITRSPYLHTAPPLTRKIQFIRIS